MTAVSTGLADAPVADLDRRFYAFAIDRAVAWGIYAAAGYLAWRVLISEDRLWVGLAAVAGVILLVNLLLAIPMGVQGVSPGKAMMGLRVIDPDDGTPIGVGRALVRGLILGVGTLPLFGLGTATLAWTAVEDRTRERRGWHDLVARSLVVDVRPRDVDEVVKDERPRHVVNLTAMRLMPVRQPELPATPPRAPEGRREPRARPGWRVTFDSGESLVVAGLGLVGRGPQPKPGEQVAHLVPLTSDNMSISKTHAQFHVAGDGALVVMDRGSTNGSILIRSGVSRELSAGKPATLLDGDRVLFGDREMVVSREQP
jgi:uncharacterized RDD family membrane protein YckC